MDKAAWVGPKVGWGRVSGDRKGGSNSISQVDGVSDMAHPCWLCVSVEGGFRTFLSGRKLAPSSHLNARHFSSFLYGTAAFRAATLVLVLRGSESE